MKITGQNSTKFLLIGSKLPSSTATKERLPIHEWLAVVLIISTFLLLTIISLSNYEKPIIETEDVIASQPLVEITIEGAVKFPGIYQVEKGTPILEAINLAEPLPSAKLNKIKPHSKAVRKRKIVVK